jgi:uncharacterized protein
MRSTRPRPAWWIPGAHGQTLWGKLIRRPTLPPGRTERWETPDGDFLDLYRIDGQPQAPRVILLHGLEGGLRSHYVSGLLTEIGSRGWGADLMIFRSCGAELNRSDRSYHSGETSDLAFVVDQLGLEHRESSLGIVGVSLGGNVLLKYLGERGDNAPSIVRGAVAVSVPFDLAASADNINQGFSRVYQEFFLQSLRRKAAAKALRSGLPILAERARATRTLREFDDVITAPLHGFSDANDYYNRCSSIHSLGEIRIKTLLISAADDPFLPPEVLKSVQTLAEENHALELDFLPWGGHVGFVAGTNPLRPDYYMERRVGEFLARCFGTSDHRL